jgi:NADH:ubiquinone oxidoreductase subunit 2 (subunit N)
MINVAVSLYYYLQVVKAAFLLEPDEELSAIKLSAPATILTALMVAVISVDGIFSAICLS